MKEKDKKINKAFGVESLEDLNRKRQKEFLGFGGKSDIREHGAVGGQFQPREERRNLTLVAPVKIKHRFSEFSKWEKLFIVNFYTGKKGKELIVTKENKYAKVREDIEKELARLYAFAEAQVNFRILTNNNPHLERQFESELKTLEHRGDAETVKNILANKEQYKKGMAQIIAASLHAEFKHLVDFIKDANFEPAFKALILQETLAKTYKRENGKTIVEKREVNKTIQGHMNLSPIVLSHIYNCATDKTKYADLYFEALEIARQKSLQRIEISLENVNAFGKGRWIKFPSKQNDSVNYVKNAQDLSILVQGTDWCTKNLASSELAQGDFYVFVDNDNKPHIAIKMMGDELDELRGLGCGQELEHEYREIALEFLRKNPNIQSGEKWLKKEEWNNELINYIKKINNNTFVASDVANLIKIIADMPDYKILPNESNGNWDKLNQLLPKCRSQFVKFFNCDESNVCTSGENITEDTLYFVGNIKGTEIPKGLTSFKNLKYIFGSINRFGDIRSLGSLEKIYGDVSFMFSKINDLGALNEVVGSLILSDFTLDSLKNLKRIGRDALFCGTELNDLGALTEIGGNAHFMDSTIKSLKKLERIGGNVRFSLSGIEDFGALKEIGGNAEFYDLKIKSFGKLKIVKGNVYFSNDKQGQKLEKLFHKEFKQNKYGHWERIERKSELIA